MQDARSSPSVSFAPLGTPDGSGAKESRFGDQPQPQPHPHPHRLSGEERGELKSVASDAASSRLSRACGRLGRDLSFWADARAIPSLAILAATNCVAAMVLARKLGGGVPLHLSNVRLCVAAIAASGLSLAGRWNLGRLERHSPALATRMLLAFFSVLPLVVLFTAVGSRHSPWAVSLLSGLAVATWTTVLTWRRLGAEGAFRDDRPAPTFNDAGVIKLPRSQQVLERPAENGLESDSRVDRSASDWAERTTNASGQVTLRGQLQVAFAAGQTHTAAHVPFWPPFAHVPEFSCELVDQPAVRARPAVFRYGARLELRRTGDIAAPLEVSVRFHVALSSDASRAA